MTFSGLVVNNLSMRSNQDPNPNIPFVPKRTTSIRKHHRGANVEDAPPVPIHRTQVESQQQSYDTPESSKLSTNYKDFEDFTSASGNSSLVTQKAALIGKTSLTSTTVSSLDSRQLSGQVNQGQTQRPRQLTSKPPISPPLEKSASPRLLSEQSRNQWVGPSPFHNVNVTPQPQRPKRHHHYQDIVQTKMDKSRWGSDTTSEPESTSIPIDVDEAISERNVKESSSSSQGDDEEQWKDLELPVSNSISYGYENVLPISKRSSIDEQLDVLSESTIYEKAPNSPTAKQEDNKPLPKLNSLLPLMFFPKRKNPDDRSFQFSVPKQKFQRVKKPIPGQSRKNSANLTPLFPSLKIPKPREDRRRRSLRNRPPQQAPLTEMEEDEYNQKKVERNKRPLETAI